jgi:hypothetical protein
MNEADDDAIEALLRADFEGPVEIGDFGDRVMAALPRRRWRRWPRTAGLAAGAIACWLSLLAAPLPIAGWRDWLDGRMSAPALILIACVAAASLLALAWAVLEADAGRGPIGERP